MNDSVKFIEAMKEAQIEAHRLAKEKGWYDHPVKTPLEALMLVVSELGEAAEEIRKGTPPIYQEHEVNKSFGVFDPITPEEADWDINKKPEGEGIELADVFLRLFDYAEYRGLDLGRAIIMKHAFNRTRPYRHNKKI